MNLPSVKTLERDLWTTPEKAKAIRAQLESARDRHYKARSSTAQDTIARLALEVVSETIGMYGVEYLASPEGKGIIYVNTGDPYSPPTLMWDESTRRYLVGSWGDVVERQEHRFRDGPQYMG